MPTELPIHKEDPMPVLSRDALEASPLADLHAIASELGIDGFRRLRKADLVDAILEHQGGDGAAPEAPEAHEAEEARPRRRRGGRGRARKTEEAEAEVEAEVEEGEAEAAEAPEDEREE